MVGGQVGIVPAILPLPMAPRSTPKVAYQICKRDPIKSFNGSPAHDFSQSLRIQSMTRNLPELEKRVKELEKLVEQLLAER
jgi:UDP-3-O-[3-hydroxymyristoyl] glucosamine N-acyltransferase